MKKLIQHTLTILSCLLTISACEQLDYTGEPHYVLYIEDAPAEYKSVMVAVENVELFNGSTWTPLNVNKKSFDLLKQTGGVMFRAAEAFLPEGEYSKIRVTLNPKVQLKNNIGTYNLTTNNNAIELNIKTTLKKDTQHAAILDIDAANSIRETLVNQDINYTFSLIGSMFDISTMGVVNMLITNQKNIAIAETILITATNNETQNKTATYSNASSAKALLRLTQGTYTINITPAENSKFLSKTIENVVVQANEPTNLGVVNINEKDIKE